MSKEVLTTGSSGLVGSRFIELQKQNFNIISSDIDTLDIINKEEVHLFFEENEFDVVIHFAAYTNVNKAEEQRGDEQEPCWKVNVAGTRNLVEAIDPTKTHFVHISTDMVFPGNEEDPGPYAENHEVKANIKRLTWYGYTKSQAEKIVVDTVGLDKATILRLIYPVRAQFEEKLDFLRKFLKRYDQGKLHPLFSDQQISICFIDEASIALRKIIEKKGMGIFHASSTDLTSPHEIVNYLIENVRGKKNQVTPSSINDFLKKADNPVRYPQFGGLKVDFTEGELDMKFSNWKTIVDSLVRQGIGK